ncbi:MAG: hypothetical protein KJ915_09390 [Candidatus Omnitrophica bacterium]|nr:hypothetical protein [Candidatus Omnitrophota bacterium]
MENISKIFNQQTITGLALLFSFMINRKKTFLAVKIAYKKLIDILPAFLFMLIFISITLFIFPSENLANYFGKENQFQGVLLALFLGSVTLVPGFIAFPLCGILLKEGVSYTILSAFTTSLMMVGVLTYPIEKKYFGKRVTIIRNSISLFIAIIVAIITGIFFGEIF